MGSVGVPGDLKWEGGDATPAAYQARWHTAAPIMHAGERLVLPDTLSQIDVELTLLAQKRWKGATVMQFDEQLWVLTRPNAPVNPIGNTKESAGETLRAAHG